MKLGICLLICCVIVFAQALSLTKEQKAKVKQHHAACLDETKVEPSLVKKARKGQLSEDESLKKYIFCFMKRADLVTDKGKLKEEVALAKLPPGANVMGARLLMEMCKNTNGKDPADNAFLLYKCYKQNSPTQVTF